MYFVIFLAVIFLLLFLMPFIQKGIEWLISKFSDIPDSLRGKILPVFVKELMRNWYTFLVLILIWALLFKTDVGKDMVDTYLANLKGYPFLSALASYLFLFLCTLLLSLSIWSLPFFMYSGEKKEEILTGDNYENFYLTTKTLAFVAMLPFLIISNAFLSYSLPPGDGVLTFLFFNSISLIVFLFIVYLFSLKIFSFKVIRRIKIKFRNNYLLIMMKIIILVILLSIFFTFLKNIIPPDKDLNWLAYIVALFLFISSVIVFRLLIYSREQDVEAIYTMVKKMLSDKNQHDSRIFFNILFWSSLGAVLYFYFVPSLVATNSLYILLVVFGFYIIYLSFWRNKFNNTKGFWRIVAFFASIVFLVLPFIYSKKQFTVPLLDLSKSNINNTSLEFQLKQRYGYIEKLDSTGNVFIVCAMGGGSRAGFITASVLETLDRIEPDFFDNTICYSTISGGSVGMYNYLKGRKDSIIFKKTGYLKNLYQANYNSSGVYGLLIGDALETLFGRIITKPKRWLSKEKSVTGFYDRNFRIRQEYDYMLRNALSRKPSDNYGITTFYPWRRKDSFVRDTFRTYFNRHAGKIPIHLINTFEINSGRRTVISPFSVNDTAIFLNTILPLQDKAFSRQISQKDIYYRDAVNLSELFPLISAASHIGEKKDAQFVDGGYYENYGLATALDVFYYLRDSVKIPLTRLKIILIKNSKQEPKDSGHTNQFIAPLVGVMNAPFTGHANNLLAQSKRILKDSNHIYVIEFDAKMKKVPLTRSLTEKHIDSMNLFNDSILRNRYSLQNFIKN